MQDQLDKFMMENRAAFDDAVPDIKIWDDIEKAMTPAGPARMTRIWGFARAAAIAILLVSLGAIGGQYVFSGNDGTQSLVMQEMQTEYAEAEAYYVSQINERLDKVKSFDQSEPVLEDIASLDEEFSELRSRLGDEVTDELIISAMIENYKTKIQILERVLDRMEKSEQEKTNKNEEIKL